jgi:hypothetical protein
MIPVPPVRRDNKSCSPCSLANQKEVCYSNAMLQCFAKLIDPFDLEARLKMTSLQDYRTWCTRINVTSPPEVDKCVQETNLRDIDPTADFIRVLKSMQKPSVDIVYPYYFQAILAAKGGKNGEEFSCGEGAYPFCWFRFTLNSLCQGTRFDGQSSLASHPVIDEVCKVRSAFAYVCRVCLHKELDLDALTVTDWGLRLDPKGAPLPFPDQPSVSVQQLLKAHRKYEEARRQYCVKCRKYTSKECAWEGLLTTPEILPIEVKTYERNLTTNRKTTYKFFFSNIIIDSIINIPYGDHKHTTKYELQAVVKLEGKCHEHAVAFVRSDNNLWWKCSDEDITQSTWEAAQRTQDAEQASVIFYRRVPAKA